MKKQKKKIILENVLVTDYAAEGKALAKADGKVIFISGAVPGDVADLFVTKNKKDWAEARVQTIKEYSKERVEPFCKHFGVCGGCKWQMLPYEKQLQYKQQEVEQNLRRIGKVQLPPIMPIIGADADRYYRNKLEFTFSNKRYLLPGEMTVSPNLSQSGVLANPEELLMDADVEVPALMQVALGYHAPRIFDKIIDIEECYLMDDVNNAIRNTVRSFALENNFSF